mgnify:CR=1 FL=1
MPEPRRVAGVVDRVEGDVAVIVFRDPDTGDHREVYLDKKKPKRVDLKEGDDVTVEMSQMAAKAKKDTVSISFMGIKAEDMAKRLYTYLIDGGLEDHLIKVLSGKGVTLAIEDYSNKRLAVLFECWKEKSTKKPVKKLEKAKKTVKKVAAKRGKTA